MSTQQQTNSKPARHDDYGQRYELASALYDGPLTAEELAEHLRSYLKWIGLFSVYLRLRTSSPRERLMNSVRAALDDMLAAGWVVQSGDMFELTELGRKEAEKPLADFRRTRGLLETAVQPSTVSKVSLGVHLFLAAIKLPVGFVSGSVGLLSDGVDTMLDGFASLLVFIGIRSGRERMANVILVVLMLLTGSLAFYEAIRRFFLPVQPDVDWVAYVAILVSAIFCAFLWFYQRFVGVQTSNMALVTQSIDSRNHVIVAIGVTAGLIAAAFQMAILDTIVGAAVAVLILKSAIEVAADIIRSWNEESFDVSAYRLGILDWYQQFREDQFCDWLLSQVYTGRVRSDEELERSAFEALDFSGNRSLMELGLSSKIRAEEVVPHALELIHARGWLQAGDVLELSEAGKIHLMESRNGVWLAPEYDDDERMKADMAHFLGRVAHDGRGPQRRKHRRSKS